MQCHCFVVTIEESEMRDVILVIAKDEVDAVSIVKTRAGAITKERVECGTVLRDSVATSIGISLLRYGAWASIGALSSPRL
jgi:hypothetical protein